MGHFRCLGARYVNEHGYPPFLFQNWSSHMINIQWTKFERKSIVTFISEERLWHLCISFQGTCLRQRTLLLGKICNSPNYCFYSLLPSRRSRLWLCLFWLHRPPFSLPSRQLHHRYFWTLLTLLTSLFRYELPYLAFFRSLYRLSEFLRLFSPWPAEEKLFTHFITSISLSVNKS